MVAYIAYIVCGWRFAQHLYFRCLLVEFLLHRHGAKNIILGVLKEMILPKTASTLSKIGEVFNRLNQVSEKNELTQDYYLVIFPILTK